MGTIDFYCFIPLSLTVTLAGRHKVSAKQNLLASFIHTLFKLIRMKFDMVLEQFKLNILILVLTFFLFVCFFNEI